MAEFLSWLPDFDAVFVPAEPLNQLVVSAKTLRKIGKDSDGSVWGCVKRGLEEGVLVGSDPIEPKNLFIVASDISNLPNGEKATWITLAPSKQD